MMERKSLMSIFFGLVLCVSLWQFMLQQQQEQTYDISPLSASDVNDSVASTTSSTPFTTVSSDIQLEKLPKSDVSQLIDLVNFEYLINHRACKELKQQPTVVIMVHSAPDNFNKRNVIRQTWAGKNPNSLLIFLLGSVSSTYLQTKIEFESRVHGDVVQGNFGDAYRNMTYKHVMALKWFVYNCPRAHFLLKTDDDVFINTPLLFSYLHRPSRLPSEHLLFCYASPQVKVKRTYRSKWRVSYEEYMHTYYPSHCPGFSILYSADVVNQLYLKAQHLPYFWIDDVHITGNVASKLNITIEPTRSLLLAEELQRGLLNGEIELKSVPPFLFARPNMSEEEIRKLWKIVQMDHSSENHASTNVVQI